jgi:PAS domain S-box-containing protein
VKTVADEVQYLRRCVRDLVAFTTLPAVWTGREPRAIVESLADVFLRTLGLDLVYICMKGSQDEVAHEAARAARQPEVAGQTQAIGRALARWLESADSSPPTSIPNPAGSGTVRLAVIPIGYEGEYGVVAAGSQRGGFPTELDRLLLNVGANQIAIWLQKDHLLAREQAARTDLQRVAAELAEWKNRYEAAIQATGQLLYDWNLQTQQVLWGGQPELSLGYSLEEMPRTLVGAMALLHPDDRAAFTAEIERVSATRTPLQLEYRLRRKDGAYITVESKGHFVLDSTGNATHMVGFVVDITARKQAEEDRARLAAIVESSEDAILSKTLDGVILSWNTSAERLYGYTAVEIIGQPVSLLAPPEQLEEMQRILEQLRQGERVEHYETVRRKKDGTRIAISLTVSPVKNAAGQVIGASAIARDITARKQAEEALRESEDRFRALVNAAPAMVWAATPDGTMSFVTDRWLQYCGLRAEQLARDWPQLVLHPDDYERYVTQWTQALAQGTLYEIEVRNRRHDGEYRWFLTRAVPARTATGRIIGWYGTTLDIHDRKLLEDELRQFSYIVAHDLNEPLRTIGTFVHLLARRYQGKLDATADEYITFVTDSAQRMQQMILDLLTYTRTGGQDLTLAPVDCEALLARVLIELQGAITESGATITHDPLPIVQGDAARLGQVLQNLIGNALKFRGEAPPQIQVSAQHEDHHWRFSVRDNGIGIDPRHAERIFQVFQRLHTRQEYAGTGIGLAICKKIIERHGGRIWVESRPGEGSIFYFTISEIERPPDSERLA